jgi:murein DD-endopeptidase MepM/ murein hydrolase activator NlpD
MRPSLSAIALLIIAAQIGACNQNNPAPPPSPPGPVEPPPAPPPPPPPPPAPAPGPVDPNGKTFTYRDPGELAPGGGSGLADDKIYLPGMRFPIENAPAYANSQVYNKGGMYGGGGTQCDSANYSYPWRDTFCETRSWTVALCESGKGHQGQDIRPSTCAGAKHWAVAAEDGQITAITGYTVTLVSAAAPQRIYRYLHMKMSALPVSVGEHVTRGQHLGLVNNDFPGGTTYHLHFDVKTSVTVNGSAVITYVPPYASLVDAYERLLSGSP